MFTGIKVIDLIEPYAKGGKIIFSEEQELKTVLIQELINNIAKGHGGLSVLPELERELEKGMTFKRNIESGIINYGDKFLKSMEKGEWDLQG